LGQLGATRFLEAGSVEIECSALAAERGRVAWPVDDDHGRHHAYLECCNVSGGGQGDRRGCERRWPIRDPGSALERASKFHAEWAKSLHGRGQYRRVLD